MSFNAPRMKRTSRHALPCVRCREVGTNYRRVETLVICPACWAGFEAHQEKRDRERIRAAALRDEARAREADAEPSMFDR
jgi:hypothetical protein